MGEAGTLRQSVFRRAYYHLCNCRSGGVLPIQLGITREVLVDIARLNDIYFIIIIIK